jgi:nicotinate phosphoribosyltransferase
MVDVDGRPTSKLSPGKVSLPGRKQVFRGSFPGDDVLTLRDAQPPPGALPMLVPVMARGTRLEPAEPLEAARERFVADLQRLPEAARRLEGPEAPEPEISDELALLARRVQDEARMRGGQDNSDKGARQS